MFVEIRQEMEAALPPNHSINSNGVKVAIVIGAFWAIATASVIMRFYARHIKGGLYVLEDWLIFGALVGFLSLLVRMGLNRYADHILRLWNRKPVGSLHRWQWLSCHGLEPNPAPDGPQGKEIPFLSRRGYGEFVPGEKLTANIGPTGLPVSLRHWTRSRQM